MNDYKTIIEALRAQAAAIEHDYKRIADEYHTSRLTMLATLSMAHNHIQRAIELVEELQEDY